MPSIKVDYYISRWFNDAPSTHTYIICICNEIAGDASLIIGNDWWRLSLYAYISQSWAIRKATQQKTKKDVIVERKLCERSRLSCIIRYSLQTALRYSKTTIKIIYEYLCLSILYNVCDIYMCKKWRIKDAHKNKLINKQKWRWENTRSYPSLSRQVFHYRTKR